MKEIPAVLYLGACVLWLLGINAEVCNDLDSDVCSRLLQLRPDMCSDGCFSSICTRFCGRCPLKCYKCHEIDHPANCTTVIDCPSGDHYCFTTQTFTDTFEEQYNMGCAVRNLCEQNVNAGKRSDLSAKGSCCTMDNCNNKLPSEIDLLPHRTTATIQNTTASPLTGNNCDDLDSDICLRISLADPSFCSNNCIASQICPRMCRKCFQCYECNDLDTPADCKNTITCTAGKECFQLQTLSVDLRPVYRLGCLDENLCHRFGQPIQTGFGRRQSGVSLTGGCCKTDLCNRGTLQQMHETSNCNLNHQNIQNHCPVEFTFETQTRSCYHVGARQLTWNESVQYCKGICGRLADFGSLKDLQTVVPQVEHSYVNMDLWIDAVKDSHSIWVWSNNNAHLSQDLSHFLTASKLTCAASSPMGSSLGGVLLVQATKIQPHTCTDLLHPLCETLRF